MRGGEPMKISQLMQILDQPDHRNISDIPVGKIIAYHLTAEKNVPAIKAGGITAHSSQQSYDRPAAVYFFVDKAEITPANIDILGLSGGCAIIRVAIPAAALLANGHWDGLYNVGFGTYSSIQYRGDVPKNWIVE